ncbi:MAG: hypothetical protein WDN10_01010 [bacterium]
MARSIILESDPEARVGFNAQEGAGHEKTESRVVIDISGYKLVHDTETEGGLHVVQLYLTVPQMAQLVRMFFLEIAKENIYAQLLRRLLRQRWKVMTNGAAKHMGWMPRYDQGV